MFLKFATNICRVCLEAGATVPIFGENNYCEKLKCLAQLEIKEEDGLPDSLCENCINKVILFVKFREQIISSDKYLTSFIHSINTKFSEVASEQKRVASNVFMIQPFSNQKCEPNGTRTEIDDSGNVEEILIEEENLIEEANFIEESEINNEEQNEEIEEIELLEELTEKSPEDSENSLNELFVIQKDTNVNSKKNQCIDCNKYFSSKSNLMRHTLSHTEIKPFICFVCDSTFTQSSSLKQHMLKHTGEKPHVCSICAKGFTRKRMLVMHVRTHTGEKPFSCDQCPTAFASKAGLRRHVAGRHDLQINEIFSCTICKKLLRSKHTLKAHERLHKQTERSKQECTQCDKKFLSKYSLQYHMRIHTDVTNSFFCEQCRETFPNKLGLEQHMTKHMVKNDLTCEICNISYVRARHLFVHMQTHEKHKEKNYSCRRCGKQFTLRINLVEHLKIHTSPTLAANCIYCNLHFNSGNTLRVHLISYHSEDPSNLKTCITCSIPFLRECDLEDHIQITHNPIERNCLECDATFDSLKDRETHILQHDIIDLKEDKVTDPVKTLIEILK